METIISRGFFLLPITNTLQAHSYVEFMITVGKHALATSTSCEYQCLESAEPTLLSSASTSGQVLRSVSWITRTMPAQVRPFVSISLPPGPWHLLSTERPSMQKSRCALASYISALYPRRRSRLCLRCCSRLCPRRRSRLCFCPHSCCKAADAE